MVDEYYIVHPQEASQSGVVPYFIQEHKHEGYQEIWDYTTLGCLLWMDDVVLIHHDKEELQKMLNTTNGIARRFHIKFGREKSRLLTIGNDEPPPETRLLGRPQPQMYPPVALNQYTLVNRTHKHYIYMLQGPHKHLKITPKLNNM